MLKYQDQLIGYEEKNSKVIQYEKLMGIEKEIKSMSRDYGLLPVEGTFSRFMYAERIDQLPEPKRTFWGNNFEHLGEAEFGLDLFHNWDEYMKIEPFPFKEKHNDY